MAVYVDKMQLKAKVLNPSTGKYVEGLWSHMVADTEQELDDFAKKIGLPRKYKQDPRRVRASMLHYDVLEEMRLTAIENGAIELERYDFVMKVRELKANGYGK